MGNIHICYEIIFVMNFFRHTLSAKNRIEFVAMLPLLQIEN